MPRKPLACFLLLATVTLAEPIEADDFQPIEQAISGGADEVYMALRCAALYDSTLRWTGKERMGDQLAANTENLKMLFLNMAALISNEKTKETPAQTSEIVFRDMNNISNIYIQIYERNYAKMGHAFAKDPMIIADLDFCNALTARIQE